ncbi:unnamed protein product [Nippostrongylus brasiliensis]|uniref:Condensin-2 complex subunit D3 (inferred by orthology to a human protein) n=1 Tax=Nippostrongylus brasiliensis TaxID=27835 RepID=A0A0N4Y0K2_NIPBR|nr:unnamed protein product [Nippostrongylus brasiliensis]
MRYAVHLLDALKTILASDVSKDDELLVVNSAMPSLQPTPASSRAPSPAHSMMSTETSDLPSSQNVPVIYPHVLNAAAENRKALLTPRIRAHAVLTIGKFCLMDERTAKATIPIFVKQLKMNRDHVVRNNIALVICDLCVRYTSMVDRYSPIIAACLKDTSTLVRRQILESLASLIKEQFIRWEGQVMYRFVSTILDENDAIRDYTMFCLTDVLLTQFPDLFSNHFVECLMYFNNVPVSCEREVVQEVIDPSQRVTLYGPENEVNRMTIYKFMLSTFDDRLKFTAMAHMCNQIICPIMNGKLDFNDPCVQALLRDTLTIMTLEEIKLEMEVGKGPDGEEEPPAAVVAAAKEMITKTFRKALIEFVMPALLDLRVFLNEKRSSLRGPLYGAFRTICREHKDEIDAFLDGDQQLKAEVLYDIRRYEIREKVQRAVTLRKAEETVAQRRRSRRSLAISLRPTELSRRSGLKENEGNDIEATVPPTLNATSGPQQNTSQIEDGVSPQNDIVMNEQEAVDPTAAATSSSTATESIDSDALKISDRSRRKRSSTSGETEILPTAHEPALLSTKMEVDSDGPASDMEVDDETERKRQNDKENDHISPRPPSIKRRAYQVRSVPSIANEYLEENSQIIDDGALSDRAVSTPIKPMPNLTFRNLELSAIETDQKRTSRLGKAFHTVPFIGTDTPVFEENFVNQFFNTSHL